MKQNKDKAKKILFGRTDIGDKKWDYEKFIADNPEAKMNDEALHGWKPESQWHDPEMTGLNDFNEKIEAKPERDYYVWDNKTGESRKANKDEIGEPITIKFERPLKFFQLAKNPQLSEPESSQLVASEKPELTNEEIIKKFRETPLQFFFTWQTKVQAYCTEQGISPDDLIELHKKLHSNQDKCLVCGTLIKNGAKYCGSHWENAL